MHLSNKGVLWVSIGNREASCLSNLCRYLVAARTGPCDCRALLGQPDVVLLPHGASKAELGSSCLIYKCGVASVGSRTWVSMAIRLQEVSFALVFTDLGATHLLVVELSHIVIVPGTRLVLVGLVFRAALNLNCLLSVLVLGIIEPRACSRPILLRVNEWPQTKSVLGMLLDF